MNFEDFGHFRRFWSFSRNINQIKILEFRRFWLISMSSIINFILHPRTRREKVTILSCLRGPSWYTWTKIFFQNRGGHKFSHSWNFWTDQNHRNWPKFRENILFRNIQNYAKFLWSEISVESLIFFYIPVFHRQRPNILPRVVFSQILFKCVCFHSSN